MSDPVFVSGDFSSGTTLLFTLFRNVDGCHSLYEPLHELLLRWLIWSPRVYEGHSFVGDYVKEYRGFGAIPDLFDPSWGVSRLHLAADADEPDLDRYLSYLVGTSYGVAPRVMLKENRLTFRLAWLREHFPRARVVNVWRDCEDQWQSWVRRVQETLGREDVGQDSVNFMAFRLAAWCDDLAPTYPELAADRSSNGFERFQKLWQLSRREHDRYADVCVNLKELRHDFDGACARISAAVGFELDPARLRHLLAPEHGRRQAAGARTSRADKLLDRAGTRYAEARLAIRGNRRRRRRPTIG